MSLLVHGLSPTDVYRAFIARAFLLLALFSRVLRAMQLGPVPAEDYRAALIHVAAMQHRFLAWQNAQAEDYRYTLLAGAPSRLEGALESYHPQLLAGAPPGLEGTLPSYRPQLLSLPATAEKEVQTDIVTAANGLLDCNTEVYTFGPAVPQAGSQIWGQ